MKITKRIINSKLHSGLRRLLKGKLNTREITSNVTLKLIQRTIKDWGYETPLTHRKM